LDGYPTNRSIIAGNLAAFLPSIGLLYDEASYFGQVDVGIRIADLTDGVSFMALNRLQPQVYREPEYRRQSRVSANALREPRQVVGDLLRHLFEATTGDPAYNPLVG
jgi:hypothetical protein